MELEDMKNIWTEYDKKLDKSLQLNLILLRKLNFNNANNKLSNLFAWKLIEAGIYVFLILCLVRFTIHNLQVQFIVPAIIIGAVLTTWLSYVIRQLGLISELKMGYADAIAPLQKKLEQLKVLILNYSRFSFVLLPLYPVVLQIVGQAFLHVDFFEQRQAYFLWNVVVGMVLFTPLSVWFIHLLSKKNISKTTIKSLLIGSGWSQANSAHTFLSEIEKFEEEV